MNNLSQETSSLAGVGDKMEKKLEKLGIKTINDLIFHFPYRYEKYEICQDLSKIKINTPINIQAKISLIRNKRSWQKKMTITEAIVSDDGGSLDVIWFNQPFIAQNLKNGDKVSLLGKVIVSHGRLIMTSPIYEKINKKKLSALKQTINPIYKLTSGLTQKQLHFFIKQVAPNFSQVKEYLPKETISRQKLITISQALQALHFPQNDQDLERAIDYFKFLELFLFQLKTHFLQKTIDKKKANNLKIKLRDVKKFISSLPFTLTIDQKRSSWEVLQDTNSNQPMSRLLQGDVGSGKTIVALMSILNCLLNGKQAILMAPTEILAQQHFQTSLEFFKNYNWKIALLTSRSRKNNFNLDLKNKKEFTKAVGEQADLIIGTHSLISEKIQFTNLSLVVIDEQHRFGVSQRQEILQKNIDDRREITTPHFLSMTATPIPRSLGLVLFNGLKLSRLKNLPPGRLAVKTHIVGEEKKPGMYKFITDEIKKGRQAFVICPLIEESENGEVKSVKSEYQRLKKNIFPDIEIAMLHGKTKPSDKEQIMNSFLQNKTKIIVATSLIEVGIDIPNATIMLIEGAERFGLAQLHQFRGRVGRGPEQSYCFLSLSENKSDSLFFEKNTESKSWKRLEALKKYQDGLDLATIDLKHRGSGDFYGQLQSGFMNFRFASIFDYDLTKNVREEINYLTNIDPELKKYPHLINKIIKDIKIAHLE